MSSMQGSDDVPADFEALLVNSDSETNAGGDDLKLEESVFDQSNLEQLKTDESSEGYFYEAAGAQSRVFVYDEDGGEYEVETVACASSATPQSRVVVYDDDGGEYEIETIACASSATPQSRVIVDHDDVGEDEIELMRETKAERALSPIELMSSDEDEVLCPLTPPAVAASSSGEAPSGSVQTRGGVFRPRPATRRGRGVVAGRGRVPVLLPRVQVRGQPLVERFATDEELSTPVRETIERLENDRGNRERQRVKREREVREVEEFESEDAEDVHVEEDFYNVSENFEWRSMGDGWNGVKETFLPETSGPTRVFENAYDAFRAYWDDSLLSHIVDETNRYAQTIQSTSFQREWYNTNIHEIMILFAFWMMLGVHKMPTIKSCFSKHPLLRTEVFRSMFLEGRYWNLNRAFHLANNDLYNADGNINQLFAMGPVIEALNLKFKSNYSLEQHICIDESLTLWKGPLGFKQYIKTKSARFGIKTYQLCESSTGYLWSFFVYTGSSTTNSTLPTNSSYVIKLIEPLLNKGHVMFMDNWFNSPMLARFLKQRHTDCVGTLRSSRRHVPAVIQRAPLAEGEFIARHSGDVMVVTLQDRKRLTCISTYHDLSQVRKEAAPGRPAQFKFTLIDDYNHGMGGIDRLDQMLEPYLVERKQCAKWNKKLFKRLLNITIQNARILLQKSTNSTIDSLVFRLNLVQSILDRHRADVASRIPSRPSTSRISASLAHFPAERLTERHFIKRIPITDKMRATVKHSKNLGRRVCVWCSVHGRTRKCTAYECPQCEVPLCLDFCFEQFHTIP